MTTCAELSLSDVFGNPCRQHFTVGGTDQLAARIDALAPTIASVIQQIHARSPHATVVVVGYLPVLPAAIGCWPSMPVAIGDVPWLHGIEQKLNDMLSQEAAANGALSVNPNGVTGRDACRPPWTRWVEPVDSGSAGRAGPPEPGRAERGRCHDCEPARRIVKGTAPAWDHPGNRRPPPGCLSPQAHRAALPQPPR